MQTRYTILQLRHMPERVEDRISAFLRKTGCDIVHCTPAAGDALPTDPDQFDALIVYGGVQSANDTDAAPYIADEMTWIRAWVQQGRAYLGICLGAQLLARALGAEVSAHPDGLCEIGFSTVRPTVAAIACKQNGDAFLPAAMPFYQWHNEGFALPSGATLLAEGDTFRHQAFRYGECAFGLQFHAEVTLQIINNWHQEAAHALLQDGAHTRAQQLADWQAMNYAMKKWLHSFLSQWLGLIKDEKQTTMPANKVPSTIMPTMQRPATMHNITTTS